MSRYFPHTAYAEDQPLAHTILTTHVLTRAVTTGSIIGIVTGTLRPFIPGLRSSTAPHPWAQRVLLGASRGTVFTCILIIPALVARMWGREDIEWRDRSWRLLENKGQVETDDWTYVGMAAGAVAAAASKGAVGGSHRIIGGMGLGSVGGMVGYMAWRYGVNGGKFPESKKAERTAV